jgi:hypothetical protein
MADFIELTYYKRNSYVPEDAMATKKKFLINVGDISTITPYKESTKIRYKSTGEEFEVCESLPEIEEKINGSD